MIAHYTTRRWMATLTLALALGIVASLDASEKRPLPAFAMVMLDGAPTNSIAAAGGGTHLIVYVSPGSAPSDRLVRALKQWDSEALRARTLVIIGNNRADAQQWIDAAGADALAVRYAVDEGGEARRALKLTGAPHLLGIADGRIEWAISGVLNDPRMLESVVRTWVTRP